MLLVAMEYLCERTVIRKESNQLKDYKAKHKNHQIENHFGPWCSVKTTAHSRLTNPQQLIEFFTFENRHCDFGRYIETLNSATGKIGRFSNGDLSVYTAVLAKKHKKLN